MVGAPGPPPLAPALHPDVELVDHLIERWLEGLTDRRLRRGVFTSVSDVEGAIAPWATHWNDDPKPFVWKATADDVINKVRRGRVSLTRQTNKDGPLD